MKRRLLQAFLICAIFVFVVAGFKNASKNDGNQTNLITENLNENQSEVEINQDIIIGDRGRFSVLTKLV